MPAIDVQLPTGAYTITIECGVLVDLGDIVRSKLSGRRVMLAVDSNIARSHALIAEKSLRELDFEVTVHEIVADEHRKSLATVHAVYETMLRAKLDRGSCVIALGGGIIGDIAGFAAATFMRGLAIIQVPTTLLAMVDAAIGGKTGVNFQLPDGSLGKNLIGAFWQPQTVVCDPQTLKTLDPSNFRCGLAECIKHGMIADAQLLEFIGSNAREILAQDEHVLTDLITRSATIKATIVQDDERESGRRALLNLGHTFAHAIESIRDLKLHHGEAVAIGLIAAMHCAVHTSRLDAGEERRVRTLIESVGLPTRLPKPVASGQLLSAMKYDKKSRDGKMQLILPRGIGNASIVDDVPVEIATAALRAIGADESCPE